MDLYVCSKCKMPLLYEKGVIASECECEIPNDPWECDEEIYPILKALWDKGYETQHSCAGHPVIRYKTDAGYWMLSRQYDLNGYVSILASSVKIKDFTKYKYGCVYIEYRDPKEATIQDMRELGIELPSNYILTADDPKFLKFAHDNHQEEYSKSLIEFIRTCEPVYDIRVEYARYTNYGLDGYRKLLESRNDMAMLVDLIPSNK